jgi:head-tail adaptor
MLTIGNAMTLFAIQLPTVGIDGNGAPFNTWTEYAQVYAEIENAEIQSGESQSTGVRRELTQSATLIFRCHPSQSFTPNMRAVNIQTGDVYAVAATRYDIRRTTAYMDIIAGSSQGGIP